MNLLKALFKTLLILFLIVFLLIILLCGLLLFGDHLIYKHSVSSKEDVFEMLNNNQEEYEIIVKKMEKMFSENNEYIIVLKGKQEYNKHDLKYKVLKQFPVCAVYVKKKDNNFKVSFDLAFPPNPNSYWGIYHKQDGPDTWGEGELEEVEGVYIQIGSYFKYKTEKIKDNWYYYECWTR